MKKLQFTIETDYFHIVQCRRLLEKLIEASKETHTKLTLTTYYEIPTRRSEYTIDGYHTKKLVDMTDALLNTKNGERISVIFEDSVAQEYITNFKTKVGYLFKDKL